MTFQTCMTLLWNTKEDILKNVGNQTTVLVTNGEKKNNNNETSVNISFTFHRRNKDSFGLASGSIYFHFWVNYHFKAHIYGVNTIISPHMSSI